MFQPNPLNDALVLRIAEALLGLSAGATVEYSTLSQATGTEVRQHRHLIRRAVERAEKHLGCCYETVRGIGICRLSSGSIPDVGLAAVRRCRRAARRGKKRLERVAINSLPPAAQRRKIGYSAMLGAIELIADGRRAESIAVVADPMRPIPPQNILDMFRSSPEL